MNAGRIARASALGGALLFSACQKPDPRGARFSGDEAWAKRGVLAMPRAKGTLLGESYEITPGGSVRRAGKLIFRISAQGVITDGSGRIVATLLRSFRLVSVDNRHLGFVLAYRGVGPDRPTSWFEIVWQGQVYFFEEDGTQRPIGFWQGCERERLSCALATELALLREGGRI